MLPPFECFIVILVVGSVGLSCSLSWLVACLLLLLLLLFLSVGGGGGSNLTHLNARCTQHLAYNYLLHLNYCCFNCCTKTFIVHRQQSERGVRGGALALDFMITTITHRATVTVTVASSCCSTCSTHCLLTHSPPALSICTENATAIAVVAISLQSLPYIQGIYIYIYILLAS